MLYLSTQREVAAAFLRAARAGDFEALVGLLHPDVVLRRDFGADGGSEEVRGRRRVAGQALLHSRLGLEVRPALVNGGVGVVAMREGKPFAIGALTIKDRRIVAMDWLGDPQRLQQLDLTIFDEETC